MTVIVPVKTVSEANTRGHWTKRAARAKLQRQVVALMLVGAVRREGIAAPCVVTLTRIAPRSLDDDNLRGALKAVRDSVAAVLGVDDRHPSVRYEYGQRRGAAKAYAVEICIAKQVAA